MRERDSERQSERERELSEKEREKNKRETRGGGAEVVLQRKRRGGGPSLAAAMRGEPSSITPTVNSSAGTGCDPAILLDSYSVFFCPPSVCKFARYVALFCMFFVLFPGLEHAVSGMRESLYLLVCTRALGCW